MSVFCGCVTRWTYEQAVNLLMENTALAEKDIRIEVRRYITWPAQVQTGRSIVSYPAQNYVEFSFSHTFPKSVTLVLCSFYFAVASLHVWPPGFHH